MHTTSIVNAVKAVVEPLVAGNYDRVVEITGGRHMQSEHIREAIRRYPGRLVVPPDGAYDELDIVQVRTETLPTWSVEFNLWTDTEGRSDLVLQLTIVESGSSLLVRLDDIHVL